MAFYFLGFDVCLSLTDQLKGKAGDRRNLVEITFAGAIAGIGFWAFALPFDCIKTRIQAATFTTNQATFRSVLAS